MHKPGSLKLKLKNIWPVIGLTVEQMSRSSHSLTHLPLVPSSNQKCFKIEMIQFRKFLNVNFVCRRRHGDSRVVVVTMWHLNLFRCHQCCCCRFCRRRRRRCRHLLRERDCFPSQNVWYLKETDWNVSAEPRADLSPIGVLRLEILSTISFR